MKSNVNILCHREKVNITPKPNSSIFKFIDLKIIQIRLNTYEIDIISLRTSFRKFVCLVFGFLPFSGALFIIFLKIVYYFTHQMFFKNLF